MRQCFAKSGTVPGHKFFRHISGVYFIKFTEQQNQYSVESPAVFELNRQQLIIRLLPVFCAVAVATPQFGRGDDGAIRDGQVGTNGKLGFPKMNGSYFKIKNVILSAAKNLIVLQPMSAI